MGKVINLFSKEKLVENEEILLDEEVEETSFENIMEANRKKKEKLTKERTQANIGVLRSYRIKE
jgi:hypothetical protein